ncbi:MAG: hypothetical protein L6R42_005021 [Xanthoria sp. 1 TBL-2021]|nr:MAG: hypothetical protein L6R42_005021 [Xanthoria sp. 1 TBL-2021]
MAPNPVLTDTSTGIGTTASAPGPRGDDTQVAPQNVATTYLCMSQMYPHLCEDLEEQLAGRKEKTPEQQQIFQLWKQHWLGQARQRTPVPTTGPFPPPWLDSNDTDALRFCFAIFDGMIFKGRLSSVADVNWSLIVQETGSTILDLNTGLMTIKIRCENANQGIFSGDAAVAVMRKLLSQMSWAFLILLRCRCEACETDLLGTKSIGKVEEKWLRLHSLVLRLAVRDLGLRFEHAFPIALEKSGDNQ